MQTPVPFQCEATSWNGDIFSNMSTVQPQSTNSTVSVVKARCSPGSSSSSGSSESSPSKLPVKCDRYKTELCRTYEENGTCRYGDKCQFAHGVAELRNVARHPKYKTDLCRTFHTTGFCPYGSRCHFIHSLHERQLPVEPSRLQIQAANLLLPPLAVTSPQIPSAQINSQTMVRRTDKPVDSLLLALSSLLQAKQFAADHTARKLAASQMAAEVLSNSAVPQGLSYFSDTTSVSTDSWTSPCPSPTPLNGIHDDLTFGYIVKSNSRIQQNTSFQSPVRVPAGILTPPGSPGSVASSLNSVSSDGDGYDWPRSVWPALMSPPSKGINVSLIPDFAHSQLLTTKHTVFA